MKKQYCYKCKRDVEPVILKSAGGKECCPSCVTPLDFSESLSESSEHDVILSEATMIDAFRKMGLGESDAEFMATKLNGHEGMSATEAELAESFQRIGLTEDAAKIAAAKRYPGGEDLAPHEANLYQAFRTIGLSESTAKVAAKGRE